MRADGHVRVRAAPGLAVTTTYFAHRGRSGCGECQTSSEWSPTPATDAESTRAQSSLTGMLVFGPGDIRQ
jgi:hypothetical protein